MATVECLALAEDETLLLLEDGSFWILELIEVADVIGANVFGPRQSGEVIGPPQYAAVIGASQHAGVSGPGQQAAVIGPKREETIR